MKYKIELNNSDIVSVKSRNIRTGNVDCNRDIFSVNAHTEERPYLIKPVYSLEIIHRIDDSDMCSVTFSCAKLSSLIKEQMSNEDIQTLNHEIFNIIKNKLSMKNEKLTNY